MVECRVLAQNRKRVAFPSTKRAKAARVSGTSEQLIEKSLPAKQKQKRAITHNVMSGMWKRDKLQHALCDRKQRGHRKSGSVFLFVFFF